MIEETSAGVVIFRIERANILFLLLHYPSGHWDFVKGKIEENESMRQTARREAKEETGISDIVFLKNFRERIRYNFQYRGEMVNKKVTVFLGKTRTKKVVISDEHLDYMWADYQTAMKQITFENARRILSKSMGLLSKTLKT